MTDLLNNPRIVDIPGKQAGLLQCRMSDFKSNVSKLLLTWKPG